MSNRPEQSWSVSADWIVPVSAPPIRLGCMRGTGGRIDAVGPASEVKRAGNHIDLPGHAILPGFVNAHCHLELSGLRGKLPQNAPMPRWLLALIRNRPNASQQRQAVADGVTELLSTGTTTVGDISYNNAAAGVLAALPIRAMAFAEVTGIGPLAVGAMARLLERLKDPPQGPLLRTGISPHAPYSTAPSVYRRAVRLARRRGWPITTHLAETPGERDFLLHGGGGLLEVLAALGLTGSSLPAPGCGSIELARRLGLLEADCILAHVNYIADAELAMLAAGRASVAYCPRSSEFFGRSGHRYAEMLSAGVNVAIGTDSLASNWSLDMLAEMRAIRRQGGLDDASILRMATINGAAALGLAGQVGSLEAPKRADWTAVRIGPTQDPLWAMLEDGLVTMTAVEGGVVGRNL